MQLHAEQSYYTLFFNIRFIIRYIRWAIVHACTSYIVILASVMYARKITLHFSDVRWCCLCYKLSSPFFHSLHIRQRKCFVCLFCKSGGMSIVILGVFWSKVALVLTTIFVIKNCSIALFPYYYYQ